MRQNDTLGDLTPSQLRALEILLSGGSVSDAAETASVNRSTVHRWLRSDEEFIVSYNMNRRAMADALSARVLTIATVALDQLHEAILTGDTAVALRVVEGIGILGGSLAVTGPETLDEIRAQQARLRSERALDQLLAWPST